MDIQEGSIQELNSQAVTINPHNRKLGPRSRYRIKHDAFIEYYLQSFNGSDAAKKAGYRKNAQVHAAKLLAMPRIYLKIQQRINELKVNADETLIRLSAIARGTMEYFYDFENNQIDLDSDIAKKNFGIIKKVKQNKTVRTIKDGETIESITTEIELYDKQAALTLFMKYHSLLNGDNDESKNINNNTLIINGNVSPEFLRANNLDAAMMAVELDRLARQMKLVEQNDSSEIKSGETKQDANDSDALELNPLDPDNESDE